MNSILPKLKVFIFYASLFVFAVLSFGHQTKLLGQASAFAVIGHVLSQISSGRSLSDVLYLAASSGPMSFQFWGFWALVLILPLLITSNDFSTNLLKRNWFLLQKLIHPLYIFAMIHYGLREGISGLIKSVLVLSVLYFSRALASRGIKLPMI